MYPPQKKGSPSSRAAVLNAGSSSGLSLDQTLAHFRQQHYEAQQAREAQQRRYQQITRSMRPYVQQRLVTPRDKAIAYHAQAASRAYLRYQAITNGQARLAQQVQQRTTTYISQGENLSAGEVATRKRDIELYISRQKYEEHIRATNSSEISNSILHDPVMQSVAQAGLTVAGPEIAVVRVSSVVRLFGGVRAATVATRIGQAYTYPAVNLGKLTLATAGQVGKTIMIRAGTDAFLQYAGAGIVNGSSEWEKRGDLDIGNLLYESTGSVNGISVLMAATPGDYLRHSIRNALVANAFEVSRDPKTGWQYKHAEFTWSGGFNYAQKVGWSVGADYTAGRFAGALRPYQGAAKSVLVRSKDLQLAWLYRQRLGLLTSLEVSGGMGVKVLGGVSGSLMESSFFISPTPLPPPINEHP